MKKSIITLILLVWFELGFAAGSNVPLLDAKVDLSDRASLQHGGKLFVNYCLSCHSLSYVRYNRLGKDLGLSNKQVKENLIFADAKIGSTMTTALNKEDAIQWFGIAPPDLSVVARSRGADWLYSYLLSFYEDPGRPLGVNNLVFPQVSLCTCTSSRCPNAGVGRIKTTRKIITQNPNPIQRKRGNSRCLIHAPRGF